jgi:hypothetical protein
MLKGVFAASVAVIPFGVRPDGDLALATTEAVVVDPTGLALAQNPEEQPLTEAVATFLVLKLQDVALRHFAREFFPPISVVLECAP